MDSIAVAARTKAVGWIPDVGQDAKSQILVSMVRERQISAFGEYRTKRVIFEICDEMGAAQASGAPHRTRLDPSCASRTPKGREDRHA